MSVPLQIILRGTFSVEQIMKRSFERAGEKLDHFDQRGNTPDLPVQEKCQGREAQAEESLVQAAEVGC